jgi:hypothetical protein
MAKTNKTDHHDKTEILLKVALNTIKRTNKQTMTYETLLRKTYIIVLCSFTFHLYMLSHIVNYCIHLYMLSHIVNYCIQEKTSSQFVIFKYISKT